MKTESELTPEERMKARELAHRHQEAAVAGAKAEASLPPLTEREREEMRVTEQRIRWALGKDKPMPDWKLPK